MIGTGLAILAAGALGAGASMYSANRAADVQGDAARAGAAVQERGMDNALAFQKDVYGGQLENYGKATGNLTPFINNGIGASNILAGALGGDPAASESALKTFYNSPDYQFALKGGSDALDNSAAAKGGMIGGNQMRAQTEYGAGLATSNLQSYFARLSGMAGQGIQAAGTLGQFGSTLGNGVVGANTAANITGSNNIAQSNMAAGTADASGVLGMAKGFNSGLSSLALYNQMGRSSYGSMGGTGSGSYLMGGGSPSGYGAG